MSKPSVSVSSVEITIGERSFTLTLAEAKELKRVLGELLPDTSKPAPAVIERIIERNAERPAIPVPWPSWPKPHWDAPIITCRLLNGTEGQ
jgi:hypothetical protein